MMVTIGPWPRGGVRTPSLLLVTITVNCSSSSAMGSGKISTSKHELVSPAGKTSVLGVLSKSIPPEIDNKEKWFSGEKHQITFPTEKGIPHYMSFTFNFKVGYISKCDSEILRSTLSGGH